MRGVEGDGCLVSELSAALNAAVARKAWIAFVFHGVGGGHHMAVDRSDFSEFLAVLAADHRNCVLTFVDAAKSFQASPQ